MLFLKRGFFSLQSLTLCVTSELSSLIIIAAELRQRRVVLECYRGRVTAKRSERRRRRRLRSRCRCSSCSSTENLDGPRGGNNSNSC